MQKSKNIISRPVNKLDPIEFTKKENNLMSNNEDKLANSCKKSIKKYNYIYIYIYIYI